ncbi:hypothetical protein ABW16_01610 [Mycolicibacter heraklionensis]|uniref:Integral membrane protein n=1 Tax=Mycolicibacter heraklionensis TaxID=512402 RepID=A0ABR5FKJ9_9MYCO|nr:hypothetical protein [Mycolicibacter heraklionensis]KLO31564.1 hypothetical protein ABW16_01610 [Mycolicibacter heraklionensis]
MESPQPESRYQRLAHGIAERRLTGLTRGERAAVLLLIGMSGIAVFISALMVFDKSAVDVKSEPTWHGVNGVMILGGLAVSTSLLAAALRPSEKSGASGRVLTATAAALPYGGLAALCLTVLFLDLTSLGAASTMLALAFWICLAAGCLWAVRRAPTLPARLLERSQAMKVLVPAALLLLLAALAAVVGRSTWIVEWVLAPTLILVAFSAVAVLPALSTVGAAKGLETLHNRGTKVAEKVRVRPWTLFGMGLAKLAIITWLWLAYRSQGQSGSKVGTSWSAWIAGVALALLVMTLFSVNRRLTFSDSDHLTVSRTTGLLVGAALIPIVVVAFVSGVRTTRPDKLLTIIAIAIVIIAAVVASRMEQRRQRIAAVAATLALAVFSSLWLLPRQIGGTRPESTVVRSLREVSNPPAQTAQPITVGSALEIIEAVLAVSVVALLVATFASGRKSLGVYLTAVLVWLLSRYLVAPKVAPEMTDLNFDLVLTAVLTATAALWAAGRRGPIDPFEIAATMTVTFFLIELPLLGGLMPNPPSLKLWLAVLALVTAAVGAIWSILADLAKPAEQRDGFVRLCTSTLLLYLLLAFAWTLTDGATALVQGISGLVLSYLAIPLGLLLVAAAADEQTTEHATSRQASRPHPAP